MKILLRIVEMNKTFSDFEKFNLLKFILDNGNWIVF